MEGWTLILAAIGQVIAMGTLLVVALQHLGAQLDRRFASAEAVRVEASKHHEDQFLARDKVIDELSRRVDVSHSEHQLLRNDILAVREELASLKVKLAENYVPRDVWLEAIGSLNIKIDKLAERLLNRGPLHA